MPRVPPEGKRFKPGQSGNPRGMIPTSPEVKYVRKITSQALEEIGDLILSSDKDKLRSISEDETESVIRRIYAKAATNAMTKGDLVNLEMILNRVIGKVREKVDVSSSEGFKVIFEDYRSKKD